jgi:flagellar basal-body rod modification protein FlgD
MSVTSVGSATSASQSATSGKNIDELGSQDFLQLLISELSNQDPFEPMKNQDLMNEIGSIRNLQMNTSLNQTLQGLVLQGNLGAAANLIGKTVSATDAGGKPVTGTVAGVQISDNQVQLALDNGAMVGLDKVTQVFAAPAVQGG